MTLHIPPEVHGGGRGHGGAATQNGHQPAAVFKPLKRLDDVAVAELRLVRRHPAARRAKRRVHDDGGGLDGGVERGVQQLRVGLGHILEANLFQECSPFGVNLVDVDPLDDRFQHRHEAAGASGGLEDHILRLRV